MQELVKSPTEIIPNGIDWAKRVPTGTTLASCVGSIVDAADLSDKTAAMLVSSTGTISGLVTTWKVRAGTAGQDYLAVWQATDSNGLVYEQAQAVQVRAHSL
jgi:hypothetical protein